MVFEQITVTIAPITSRVHDLGNALQELGQCIRTQATTAFSSSSWTDQNSTPFSSFLFSPVLASVLADAFTKGQTPEEKEKTRKLWHQSVIGELEELRVKEPQAYDRIPSFLCAPEETIDGSSYTFCFYGYLNHNMSFNAHMMSANFKHLKPVFTSLAFGTPIESLVMAFYHRSIYGARIEEFEGVTRELFRSWIQAYYREHKSEQPTIVSEYPDETRNSIAQCLRELSESLVLTQDLSFHYVPVVAECVEEQEEEDDGSRSREIRSDLCRA